MSNKFGYQTFVAFPVNLGGKVAVVEDISSFHDYETYFATSLDQNSRKIEFQVDPNFYVDLRHSYMALKLKLVKCRGEETYKSKKMKRITEKRPPKLRELRKERTREIQIVSLLR